MDPERKERMKPSSSLTRQEFMIARKCVNCSTDFSQQVRKGQKTELFFTTSNAHTGWGCCSGNSRSVIRSYDEVVKRPASLGVRLGMVTHKDAWL